MSILELKQISKSFKQGVEEYNILENLDFTINQGEIVALVGPSGSGKTTFLQIAGLLDSPTSGQVIITGKDCTKNSEEQNTIVRRANLGFVYQFHHLFPEFTAIENLVIPLLIKKFPPAVAGEKATQLLNQFGLGNRIGNMPSELSGGEQQRVAIARALIVEPQLILADEPTGNLDHENAERVFDFLLKEVRRRNIAAIIVTHNLEIARKTDKIYTINNRKLVEIK